uniref:Uncharacterized protein n=1 Tax=Anguilla anguilla TaxID=7936 RepID=A0A0E9QSA3_ANGAN
MSLDLGITRETSISSHA